MRKIINLILVAALIIGCLPLSAMAVADNSIPFADVSKDSWYYDAVIYSFNKGIFKGTNANGTEFSPNRTITRAEFATTLFRFSNVKESAFSGESGFSDVYKGTWMSAPIKWASEMGYVKGTGSNKFDPNGTLDRAQLATMLYRFANKSFDHFEVDEVVLENFADSNTIPEWANDAMVWAASVKVLNGNDKGMLAPAGKVTRAQVAQVLMNFDGILAGSDASGLVNSDLVLTINNAGYNEAKNIIYMIGDGMGYNIIEVTEYVYKDQLYNGKLAMNYIPQVSFQTTYSADNYVTDSAAGGTALSTGLKTANNVVGMDPTGEEVYTNVLELAAQKGKSTGVIATKSVTDATPAAFTAHTAARQNEHEVAIQQIEKITDGTLDILLGGGVKYYSHDESMPVLEAAVDSGKLNYSTDYEATKDLDMPILGLYADDSIDTFDEEQPTVAEMTELALDKLSADENGFFLMVEGSQIDSFGHFNELEKSMHETYQFDCAIAVALDFIAKNPDTVLVITADHETGGIIVPGELNDDNFADVKYTTDGHSSRNVPVYALGYGVEAIDGLNENVDIAMFIASLLGEDDFGIKSSYHNLVSKNDEEDMAALVEANPNATIVENGIEFVIDNVYEEFDIPVSIINCNKAEVDYLRVLHVEFTNTADTYARVPSIYLNSDLLHPHVEYLDPGESRLVSYILPEYVWHDQSFLTKLVFLGFYLGEPHYEYDPGSTCLTMGDVFVTNRNTAN